MLVVLRRGGLGIVRGRRATTMLLGSPSSAILAVDSMDVDVPAHVSPPLGHPLPPQPSSSSRSSGPGPTSSTLWPTQSPPFRPPPLQSSSSSMPRDAVSGRATQAVQRKTLKVYDRLDNIAEGHRYYSAVAPFSTQLGPAPQRHAGTEAQSSNSRRRHAHPVPPSPCLSSGSLPETFGPPPGYSNPPRPHPHLRVQAKCSVLGLVSQPEFRHGQ